MAPRTTPPFRADHVGSLLRPKELVEARDKQKRRRDLRRRAAPGRGQGDPRCREAARGFGLQVATDGEFRRTFWHVDFLVSFANVVMVPPNDQGELPHP